MQKNIKAKIKKHNLTIAELERRIGVRHAVNNILYGRSKNPTIKITQAIAHELGCSVEELLIEEMPQEIKSKNWDLNLAKKALDAITRYLLENENIKPKSTAIFNCVNEVYQYAKYNNNVVDQSFVNWIAGKSFSTIL